jgi:hypothetical protein
MILPKKGHFLLKLFSYRPRLGFLTYTIVESTETRVL